MSDPLRHRPRRMRRTPALRALIRETELAPRHLVAPLFVKEGVSEPVPIASMPGQSQHTLETLRKEAAEIASKGVLAFMLFGVPERKDAEGSEAWNPDGIAQKALRVLREELGDDHVVIADLCLDEYTDHGHCGVLDERRPRRQRRDARALPADRDRAGRRRGADGRTQRHDGRPGRRDPRRARPRRVRTRGDHGVRGEVRLRVLRAVPRGGRVRAAVRRPHAATRWTRRTPTRRSARSRPTSSRAPTS